MRLVSGSLAGPAQRLLDDFMKWVDSELEADPRLAREVDARALGASVSIRMVPASRRETLRARRVVNRALSGLEKGGRMAWDQER